MANLNRDRPRFPEKQLGRFSAIGKHSDCEIGSRDVAAQGTCIVGIVRRYGRALVDEDHALRGIGVIVESTERRCRCWRSIQEFRESLFDSQRHDYLKSCMSVSSVRFEMRSCISGNSAS